jgi:hypothetical protein
MDIETYNLKDLEINFKKLQTDKKKGSFKTLEFILELNRQVGIDEILIREGFEIYPKKADLEKGRNFPSTEAFFRYMVDHLDTIEEGYLKESNDK